MYKSASRIATQTATRAGYRPIGPALFALVCGLGLACSAHEASADARDQPVSTTAAQQASRLAQYDSRERDTRHRRRGERPEVNVFIAPQTEHWPSNYVPDDYRLEGYDGQPDQPTRCRGSSGRTLSTGTVACPPGQQPATGGRSLSTSPAPSSGKP